MKSIQIISPKTVKTIELPKPEINSDEILIRIRYVGFCGSDLNTYLGKNLLAISPVVPGHEIAGTVEETGANVPEGLFHKGMNVTVNPYSSCGKCTSCKRHRVNACRDNQTLGVQRNGAMSEHISMPWQKVIPAEGLPIKLCALIEPMSVGFHAVARGEVTDIDTVMVIGCGMIGIGAIVRAALRGAKVIAVDIDPEKLELAKRMGAAFALDSTSPGFHDSLLEITGGDGPDVVIEAVGSSPTYIMAIEEVAFTGRVVCIGYAAMPVSIPTKLIVQKELDVRGSRNALPEDFEAVLKYLRGGNCPADTLISQIIKPENAAEALDAWDHNRGKVFRILVDFN